MCLLPSVDVPIRVDTSKLGSHSGMTSPVKNGVPASLEVGVSLVRIKAVGKGRSAW